MSAAQKGFEIGDFADRHHLEAQRRGVKVHALVAALAEDQRLIVGDAALGVVGQSRFRVDAAPISGRRPPQSEAEDGGGFGILPGSERVMTSHGANRT